MKKLLMALSLITFTATPNQLLSQSWVWANDISGFFDLESSSFLDSDAAGNTYCLVRFNEAGYYGDLTIEPPLMGPPFVLIKQSPDGNIIWTKVMDGEGSIGFLLTGLAVSAEGEIFLSGRSGAIPGTPPLMIDGVAASGPFGFISLFIYKLDIGGTAQWGVNFLEFNGQIPGGGQSAGRALLIEPNQDGSELIVSSSHRQDSLNIGGFEVALSSGESAVIEFQFYVASLNADDGSVNWANGGNGGLEWNFVNDLSVNSDDEIFVDVSWAGDTARVGDIMVPNLDNQGIGGLDNLIVKFAEDGTPIWANNIGSLNEDKSLIAASEDGGVMVVGDIIDGIDAGGFTLEAPGTYALKYNFEGGIGSFEKVSNAAVTAIDSDGQGNYVVAADFTDEVLSIGSFELENAGGGIGTSDIVLSNITESGEVLWAQSFGGSDDEVCYHIDYSQAGALTFAALYGSSELELGEFTLENEAFPGQEGFVAALNLSLGVLASPENESISIYPNPASDFVTIGLNTTELSNSVISIIDMNGRLVLQSNQTRRAAYRLDVSHLDNGIYLLDIQGAKAHYVSKFIVNK